MWEITSWLFFGFTCFLLGTLFHHWIELGHDLAEFHGKRFALDDWTDQLTHAAAGPVDKIVSRVKKVQKRRNG